MAMVEKLLTLPNLQPKKISLHLNGDEYEHHRINNNLGIGKHIYKYPTELYDIGVILLRMEYTVGEKAFSF